MSKSREMDTLCASAMPMLLAKSAQQSGCHSVAFTYNDPVIFLEYAIDTAQACHELGLASVAVTAGYICEQPRAQLFQYIDAANVDLKSFSQRFYKHICGGDLQPVLETLRYLRHETSIWLEITTLLIPEENDSDAELHALSEWIATQLGTDIQLHFSAFHPDWKMRSHPHTPAETLFRAREIALSKGLQFVYIGNLADRVSNSTYCPHCQQSVISRSGYQLGDINLDAQGHCRHCHHVIPGHFDNL